VARNKIASYGELVADSLQLRDYDEIVYLLDTNIVRDFVEPHTVRKSDIYALNYLFFQSSRAYAVPPGAWMEITEWLQRLTGLEAIADEPVADVDSLELALRLANHLGANLPVDATAQDIEEEISIRLRSKKVVLERLLHFLSNSGRFKGVIAPKKLTDRSQLAELIAEARLADARSRIRSGERPAASEKHQAETAAVPGPSIRDTRDAINLALTLEATRSRFNRRPQADPDQKTTGYILLTRATAMQTLAEFAKQQYGDAEDTSDTIRELIEFQKHRNFPCMSVRQAIGAELAAPEHASSLEAVQEIQQARKDWEGLRDHLEHEIACSQPGRRAPEKKLSRLAVDRKFWADTFLRIGRSVSRPNSLDKRLEDFRLVASSIELAQREQAGALPRPDDDLRKEAAKLISLLEQIRQALAEVPGVRYVADRVEQRPGLQRFQVSGQWGSEENSASVLEFELYYPSGDRNYKRPTHFLFCWPTATEFHAWMRAMMQILPIASPSSSEAKDARRVFVGTSEVPADLQMQGVVIHKSDVVIATELRALTEDRKLENWTLDSIARCICSIENEKQPNGGFKGLTCDAQIEQIRINTMRGDFLLDVIPEDNAVHLEAAVISHVNLLNQIVFVASRTAKHFIERTRLQECLTPFFEAFDALPLKSKAAWR
jgi:hypothetical protein